MLTLRGSAWMSGLWLCGLWGSFPAGWFAWPTWMEWSLFTSYIHFTLCCHHLEAMDGNINASGKMTSGDKPLVSLSVHLKAVLFLTWEQSGTRHVPASSATHNSKDGELCEWTHKCAQRSMCAPHTHTHSMWNRQKRDRDYKILPKNNLASVFQG